MERPKVDLNSLTFNCCKTDRGINSQARYLTSDVSSADTRRYGSQIVVDSKTRCVVSGLHQISRDGSTYAAIDGHRSRDRLRLVERQLRDAFLKSPAFALLKDREPDWDFIVGHDGNSWSRPSSAKLEANSQ